jgi:hypothetical protein
MRRLLLLGLLLAGCTPENPVPPLASSAFTLEVHFVSREQIAALARVHGEPEAPRDGYAVLARTGEAYH